MVGSAVSSRLTVDPVRTAGNYAYPIVVDPLWGFVARRCARGAIVGWLTVGGWRGAVGGCLAAAWKFW